MGNLLTRSRDRLFAAGNDLAAGWLDRGELGGRRRKLLGRARGRVLEIGIGSGVTLASYPPGVEVVGIDPSPHMLPRARARARRLGRAVELVEASAEALPFDDASFQTVVCSHVLCSVSDLDAALSEIARVLARSGELLFVEHLRSDDRRLAAWQDRLEPAWAFVNAGCHPNRATLEAVRDAGFAIDPLHRFELPLPLVKPHAAGVARLAP